MARAKILHSPASLPSVTYADYLQTPLAPFLEDAKIAVVGQQEAVETPEGTDGSNGRVVFAGYQLQDIANYRAAIQAWFASVRVGGTLVITVPHAFLFERQSMLPSRWRPMQRRLYTPSSLAAEIEEALPPNNYRLRWIGDVDTGYDYALGREVVPAGFHDVAAVIERIASPAWRLEDPNEAEAPRPTYAFEPSRTRLEVVRGQPHHKILVLKLDHLGDFIMGLPALERLRAAFPASKITLVVGPWNEPIAQSLGLFDTVLPFAAYPRNSSEEAVDVPGKKALFDALVSGDYDLAIDLRTDSDTRFFLRDVRAGLRAGMGTKNEFPFLDIFLPVDLTRHHVEAAWEDRIPLHHFHTHGYCHRTHYQVTCEGQLVRPEQGAIVWGPYRPLAPGRYLFEPFIEVDHAKPGLLGYDVALDAERVAFGVLSEPRDISLTFEVSKPARFEFRFQVVDDEPVPNFRFYGGRLVKQGASGVLHQSEYLRLLIELIVMRTADGGSLVEASR